MQTLIMNFTRIYEDQEFCKDPDFQWIHCEEMQGTDCYLDPDTENKLRKEISAFPLHGLHFIDSGNTHYMSKLWTDRIQEPFTLLVFDHHSDMKDPLFDGILSCGNWIKASLDKNPNLKKLILLGVGDDHVSEIDSKYLPRMDILRQSECIHPDFAHLFTFDKDFFKYPIYISIDKDVLLEKIVHTNWDGGSFTLQNLFKILSKIFEKGKVLGVDICGEPSEQDEEQVLLYEAESDRVNGELVKFFSRYQPVRSIC